MLTAEAVRGQSNHYLSMHGFRPSALALPDPSRRLRPVEEIATRLLSLDALFTWAALPESDASSEHIVTYMQVNHLREALTPEERAIVDLSRGEAYARHRDRVGWRLENMYGLGWVLGYDPEPSVELGQSPDQLSQAIVEYFGLGPNMTVARLLEQARLRPVAEVIALEDRFRCAHRAAQIGRTAVPDGFHPIFDGGAICERCHALSWCLSPGVAWEDVLV
jgi:hypothetical protein